ncbi:outer membrane lipoprotein-sorting protein [Betaproteobacteria bacterium GR16-43]|nr:outer membrane lipoprotein-sorting protein [Betaproteobacteria bacterium GR16-43]
MFHTSRKAAVLIAAGCAIAVPAAAELSAADLAKLGTTLTPLGGEKAGNAAGTIPAWDGGITKPIAGFVPGQQYPNPFPADKPLFTIDGKNADKYKDNLTAGAVAMMKKYPDYKMVVYQTRRTASAPEGVYKETRECAAKAQLAPGGNGVANCMGGTPFPIPKDGNEAIWNGLLRYRGDTFAMHWSQAAVTRSGDYALVKFEYEYDYSYGNLQKAAAQRENNKVLNYVQATTAPPRLAGQILLVHETVDQSKDPRSAWTYNPGQRRVRLAPNVAYDNPGTAADGLRTNDDFGMFNGATDRYNWKLVGKKEIYVPYNSYNLSDPKLKYTDILKPGHVNQDLARYELHRVWVVEATLKPGTSHIYSKRVFYLDEDSWQIAAVDKYDGRGELWRYAEQHNEIWYNIPTLFGTLEVHNDLQSGRYIAMGLRSEETKIYEPIKRSPADYSPNSLRAIGTR